jgi:hypothetical protein
MLTSKNLYNEKWLKENAKALRNAFPLDNVSIYTNNVLVKLGAILHSLGMDVSDLTGFTSSLSFYRRLECADICEIERIGTRDLMRRCTKPLETKLPVPEEWVEKEPDAMAILATDLVLAQIFRT